MNSAFIFLLLTFILVGIVLAFIPYMTRKTENFGVSIPESLYYRDDFKGMRRTYTTLMLSMLVVLSAVLVILNQTVHANTLPTLFSVVIVVHIMAGFLLYLPFHFKMKNIKGAENWQESRKQTVVIDTTFREERLTYSNWWYSIPAVIIIATIVYTFAIYDSIPDQVPIHTSFSGKVTFNDKSPGVLLILPLTQVFMFGMFLAINYVIKHSKQQVSVANPDTSKLQSIIFRRRWSLFMIITAILITLLFTFLQLTFIHQELLGYEDPVIYTITGIILLGSIILSINTGQGGSRIKVNEQTDETVIDRDDDIHWKLGQFYVNKNDPSVFIEKRFGVGWTMNFARPLTWILLGGIILLSLSPLFISLML